MPIAWRLCKKKYANTSLDGEGARLFGGRWNPVGYRVAYTSGSLALATLEMLVHVDQSDAPDDLVSVRVDIPNVVATKDINITDLPANWREYPAPAHLQSLGKAWIDAGKSPVLRVPSAVIASEANYLINPMHPDAQAISAQVVGPFLFDPRLFG